MQKGTQINDQNIQKFSPKKHKALLENLKKYSKSTQKVLKNTGIIAGLKAARQSPSFPKTFGFLFTFSLLQSPCTEMQIMYKTALQVFGQNGPRSALQAALHWLMPEQWQGSL